MTKNYVKDFKENDILNNHTLLVVDKATPMSKNNKQYMKLKLSDKTGIIESVMWDNVEKFAKSFSQGDYIKVSGIVNNYRNTNQLVLKYIEKVEDSKNIDMSNFIKSSEFNLDEMIAKLFKIIDSIEDKYINELLKKIFSNEYIFNAYKYSPAGIRLHHAFLSGLLEHSLNIVNLCSMISDYYITIGINVNKSILIAGALLHDIGKIYELNYEKGFTYTTEGQLIGHVVLGYQLMNDISYEIENFPHKLRIHLGHLILSHQGRLEFGSPKTPMSIEAFILHNIDEMDSKVNLLYNNMSKIDENNDSPWSQYIPAVENRIINLNDDINILKDKDIPKNRQYMSLYKEKISDNKDNKENEKIKKKEQKEVKEKFTKGLFD